MLGTVVENPRVVRSMPNTPSTVGQGCCCEYGAVRTVLVLICSYLLSTPHSHATFLQPLPHHSSSTFPSALAVYARGTNTTQPDAEATNSLLSSVGMCAEIPEYQMDAACGLAGSGPAYVSVI